MVPPLLKFATPICLITIIKSYFTMDDPSTIFWFRIFFGLGQSLIMATLFYVYSEIPKDKNCKRKIRVREDQLEQPSPFENLFGGGSADDKTENKKVLKMTQEEYDYKVWKKKFKQSMIGICLIPFLHWMFGLVVPLVMSVVLNTMGLIDDPLVRIYIRKHLPERNKALVRPFKFSNPMDGIQKMTDAWMPKEEDSDTTSTDSIAATSPSRGSETKSRRGNRRKKLNPTINTQISQPRAHQNNALLKSFANTNTALDQTSVVPVRQLRITSKQGRVSSKLNANAAEWSPSYRQQSVIPQFHIPYLPTFHPNICQSTQPLNACNISQQRQLSPTIWNKAGGNGQDTWYPVVKDSAIRPIPYAQLPSRPAVRSISKNVFANNDEDIEDDDEKDDEHGNNDYDQFLERDNLRQDCYIAVDSKELPPIQDISKPSCVWEPQCNNTGIKPTVAMVKQKCTQMNDLVNGYARRGNIFLQSEVVDLLKKFAPTIINRTCFYLAQSSESADYLPVIKAEDDQIEIESSAEKAIAHKLNRNAQEFTPTNLPNKRKRICVNNLSVIKEEDEEIENESDDDYICVPIDTIWMLYSPTGSIEPGSALLDKIKKLKSTENVDEKSCLAYISRDSTNVLIECNQTKPIFHSCNLDAQILHSLFVNAVKISANANNILSIETSRCGKVHFMNAGFQRTGAKKMYATFCQNLKKYKRYKLQFIGYMCLERVVKVFCLSSSQKQHLNSLKSVRSFILDLFQKDLRIIRFAAKNGTICRRTVLAILQKSNYCGSSIISEESPTKVIKKTYALFEKCVRKSILNEEYPMVVTLVVKPGMTNVELKFAVKVTEYEFVFVALQFYRWNGYIKWKKSIYCKDIGKLYYQHKLVGLPEGHAFCVSHDKLMKYGTVAIRLV